MGIYSTEIVANRLSPNMEAAFSDLSFQQIDPEKSNYLKHHGIKGQKWGVRRYQNSDGSLTNAGRKHYGVGKPKYKIVAKSPFEKQQAKLKEQEKEMSQREEIQTRKNQLKEREARLKDLGKSEETLRKEEMKRLEKELERLRKQDEKEAKKFKIKQEKEEKREQAKADKKAKKEREKERAIAEEEAEYKQKKAEKLTKTITTKKASEMTNEELQAFVSRYKLEQEYKKIQNQNNKSIAAIVVGILATSGQTAMKNVTTNVVTYLLETLADKKVKGYKEYKESKAKKGKKGNKGNNESDDS